MIEQLSRLGAALADRYRIERELGAGGMATVYLAQDLRHERPVAIKVLRPELAAVIGAERFVREIKTIAALQHPHILGLIDSGEVNGTAYYVMPYVEGESLRDRLNREQQLPVAEAVRLAGEVADALDYAHRHGVIHRDIKPENILLHDGHALVADFGIALAVSSAGGSTRMTETGMSLGTPTYMSPEQAMGEREITARSDIYALGCVAYEMLTGEPPFTGATAQAIVARMMTEAPRSLVTQRRTVPPQIEAAVLTALEKLPADRFASAREFADALRGKGGTLAMTAARDVRENAGGGAPIARNPLVLALTAALLAAIGVAAVQWRAAHRERAAEVVRFSVPFPTGMLTTNAALGTNMALAPDGRTLAYPVIGKNGATYLAVRPLSETVARTIAGTESAQQPAFSPDGRWIAYLVGNVLWKVQVAGGTPVMVGPTGVGPTGLSWTGETILVANPNGILALPAGGGASRIVARLDSAAGDVYFNQPRPLPDGNTVLFTIQPTGGQARSRLAILSLKSGAIIRSDVLLLDPLGMIDGTLVYVTAAGALSAIELDVKTGRASSSPVALGPNVLTTVAGASEAAMSPNGTLVYQSSNAAAIIGWADAAGRFQPVLNDPQIYTYPRLSPDGGRIAMAIGTGGRSDVWIYDFASATPTRLTNSGTLNDRPEWTPDGTRVLYRGDRGNRSAIWWQPADLSGPPAPLLASDQHNYFEGVVDPSGTVLAYQVDDGGATQADVKYRAVTGDTTSHPIAASEFVEAQPRFSPDGRWIASVTDASGISEVVVQGFPGPGARVQVSAGGGSEPMWARDGRRIFYRDGRHLMAATITTTPSLAVTARTAIFADDYMFAQAPHANYDVSPDGTRFLMVKSAQQPELFVVYGWADELRAQLRGAGGR
ncbi:MAG: protein kinase [Gemmatimonadota bacterium]